MKAKRVEEKVVGAVKSPPFTDTWHPVSHNQAIMALEDASKDTGIEVLDRSYSMSKDGLNVFGTWTLSGGDEKVRWMLGWRNSLAKMFALGVCCGNKVMNCSNMQFRGEFIEFRKHTGGLDLEELIEIARRAFRQLVEKFAALATWHSQLKERNMDLIDRKLLTYDVMVNRVFPPSRFSEFTQCLEMEAEEDKETAGTLYQFHGGVTRLVRNDSLFAIQDRTGLLAVLLDDWMREHPVRRERKNVN